MANGYLDAFAASQQLKGASTSSFQIPAVHGAGMSASIFSHEQLEAMGAISLDVFASSLAASFTPLCALSECISAPLTPGLLASVAQSCLSEVHQYAHQGAEERADDGRSPPVTAGRSKASFRNTLDSLSSSQRRKAVEVAVLKAVREITGSAANQVLADTPLMEAGIDSLAATELSSRVRAFGLAKALSSTLIFEHPTARAVAAHLLGQKACCASPQNRPSGVKPGTCLPAPGPGIALSGVTGRWPGGLSEDHHSSKLRVASGNAISKVPSKRWSFSHVNAKRTLSATQEACVRHGGFILGAQLFDSSAFGITPAEAAAMDPQQRLLLEVGYAGLHASSYRRAELASLASDGGVFLGIERPDWVLAQPPVARSTVYAITGDSISAAAGRISFTLGLHGPCLTIDTACSSALAALDGASTAVAVNGSSMAVSLAVSLKLVPAGTLLTAAAGMLSISGRCCTLDARANGYVRSEGIGVCILHPDDDNDHGHALCGSAVRQDGRSASLTAPNGAAQCTLLHVALDQAATRLADVACVEAHGTGTVLGDPIEAGALVATHMNRAVGAIHDSWRTRTKRAADPPLVIGAVKASLGHSEPASGLAGLLRAQHGMGTAVASGNARLRVLNPFINEHLSTSGWSSIFALPMHVCSGAPPSSGVSSFGYSGTIAHAVLKHRASSKAASRGYTLAYRHQVFAWREAPDSEAISVAAGHVSSSGDISLQLLRPGSVNNLSVRAQGRLPSLRRNEVELDVKAAGLNFRDVLNVLDLDPTRVVRPLGLECASVVRNVGEGVLHLKGGDKAFGNAMGCLASVAHADAYFQVRKPLAVSFEEACTLPILFNTNRLALGGKGMRVQGGQGLLVHAATGGVGLVGLQLGWLVNAHICVTVGRPSKAGYVRELGVCMVGSSRESAAFAYGAAMTLQTRRLHAVLSALSKLFVPTSLAMLNETSLYLEVGKNNIWSAVRMAASAARSPFCLVAGDYQTREWTQRQLCELRKCVEVGQVHPLPLIAFAFETADMIRAFNALRQGDHIGRYVATISASLATSWSHGCLPNPAAETYTSSLEVAILALGMQQGAACRDRSRVNQDPHVALFREGTTAVIELQDPSHFNAFSAALGEDMSRIVEHARSLTGVTSMVMRGAGPHFSIGGNPYSSRGVSSDVALASAQFALNLRMLYDGFLQLRTLPIPITCAVHGTLVGGGIAGCLHADWIVAEACSMFEHGNLVRGVCVLGMLSQTFPRAVGHYAPSIYLQNTQINAVVANHLGLIHAVSMGVAATKERASLVARQAAETCLPIAWLHQRLPISPAVLACEAVGHAECQLSSGGFTKSGIPSHTTPLTGSLHIAKMACTHLPQVRRIATGADAQSKYKVKIAAPRSVQGNTTEMSAEVERLCQCFSKEDGRSAQILPSQTSGSMVVWTQNGVAIIDLASHLSTHQALAHLEQALHMSEVLSGCLRSVVINIACESEAQDPSARMLERADQVAITFCNLRVPLVCSVGGQGNVDGGTLRAIWRMADYRIGAARCGAVGAAHHREGLVNELSKAPKERALQFAFWLAHHPPMGLKHMLALTRREDRMCPGHQGTAAAAAWIARTYWPGTPCESRLWLTYLRVVTAAAAVVSPRPLALATPLSSSFAALRKSPTARHGFTDWAAASASGLHRYRPGGVLAVEAYAPSNCMRSTAWRTASGDIAPNSMIAEYRSACGEDENTATMALTVVRRLMKRCSVRGSEVGKFQVFTNTLSDRSKSVKTELMSIIEADGRTDAEGVDHMGLLASGTALPLLDCINWVEGCGWDGRFAIVVCSVEGDPAFARRLGAYSLAVLIGPCTQSVPLHLKDNHHLPPRLVASQQRMQSSGKLHHETMHMYDATIPLLLDADIVDQQRKVPLISPAAFTTIVARKSAQFGRFGHPIRARPVVHGDSFYVQEVGLPSANGHAAWTFTLTNPSGIPHAIQPSGFGVAWPVLDVHMNTRKHNLSVDSAHKVASALHVGATTLPTMCSRESLSTVSTVVREVATELLPGISADAPLMEAGLDSLGSIEFRNRLAAQLGEDVELPETLIFDFPTLRQIEGHVDVHMNTRKHNLSVDSAHKVASALHVGATTLPTMCSRESLSTVSTVVREVATELLPGISADAPLMEAGLDSLGSIEFRNRLAAQLGEDVELPETLIFDFPTLRQIEGHIDEVYISSCDPAEPIGHGSLYAVQTTFANDGIDNLARLMCSALKSESATAPASAKLCGFSCRLPGGSSSPWSYHLALCAANDALELVPLLRWNVAESTYGLSESVACRCRHAGFMANIQQIDYAFFSLSLAETAAMDPQQRLLLEYAYEAFNGTLKLRGSLTGVFLGIAAFDFVQMLAEAPAGNSVYAATGSSHSVACGRISYLFGLHGPCIAYDTACSAALTACHGGIRAIRGECSDALAAGVNMMLSPRNGILFAISALTSSQGRSYTFDSRADGYARAEAVAAVALRLASSPDSVISALSSAVQQDGRSASLTAPNGQAQQHLIASVLGTAPLTAAAVRLLEAHGTGTALGDPIETGAIAGVGLAHQSLITSGVKANIGHAEPAAGITGLLKVAHGLEHNEATPNAQLHVLNPHIGQRFRGLACTLPTQLVTIPRTVGIIGGGVSSFGFGGTIVHVVLGRGAMPGQTNELHASAPLQRCIKRKALKWQCQPHPFAQRYLSAWEDVDVFRSRIDGSLLALISNHRVEGRIFFPAAGYLEMASAALSHLRALSNVFFLKPLVVDFGVHELAGQDAFADCRVSRVGVESFEVCSQVLSSGMQATLHCSGEVSSWTDVWQPDLASVRAGLCVHTAHVATAYDRFDAVGLQYGPSYRTLGQVWIGAAIAAARLRSRSALDGMGLRVHPADLDDALCACALAKPPARADEVRLPFAMDNAVLGGIPGCLWALGTQRAADASSVQLGGVGVAPQGQIHGFKSRALHGVSKGQQLRWHYEVEWVRITSSIQNDSLARTLGSVQLLVVGRATVLPPVVHNCTTVVRCEAQDQDRLTDPSRRSDAIVLIESLHLTTIAGSSVTDLKVVDGALQLLQSQAVQGRAAKPLWLCVSGTQLVELNVCVPANGVSFSSWTHRGADMLFCALSSTHSARLACSATHTTLIRLHAGGLWGLARAARQEHSALPAWCIDVGGTHGYKALLGAVVRNWGLRLPDGHVRGLQLRASAEPEAAMHKSIHIPRLSAPCDAQTTVGHTHGTFDNICRLLDEHVSRAVTELDMTALEEAYGMLERLCYQYMHDALEMLKQAEVPNWHHQLLCSWGALLPSPAPGSQRVTPANVVAAHPRLAAEVQLAERCGPNLHAVLMGAIHYQELLFPGGSMDAVLPVYESAVYACFYNQCIIVAIEAILQHLPSDRRVVLLEVGAGTGGTASSVLQAIGDRCSTYFVTDVSDVFLRQAQQRFGAQYPFVEYALLNIDADPRMQGFASHSCDMIVATNVLHATPFMRTTLRNCKELLCVGGTLIVNDLLTTVNFAQITFGMTDGWWLFAEVEDPGRVGQDSPLLTWRQWQSLLCDCGFDRPHCMQGDSFLRMQAVLVAQTTAWPSGQTVESILTDGAYFVLGGLGGLGLLTARLLITGGARQVVLASRSNQVAAGSEEECARLALNGSQIRRIRCDAAETISVGTILCGLSSEGSRVGGIFHAAHRLADATLANQTALHFCLTYGPKVHGAGSLHGSLLREAPMRFFNLFSSIAGLLGAPGQASHAAANSMLDVLASWRHRNGLCAQSVSWGAVSEIGYAARHGADHRAKALGVGAIPPSVAATALQRTLAPACRSFAVLPADWARLLAGSTEPRGLLAPYFPRRGHVAVAQSHPLNLQTVQPASNVNGLSLTRILDIINQTAGSTVDADMALMDAGMDSLGVVELRNQLQTHTGAMVLPSMLVFDHPTGRSIAGVVCPERSNPSLLRLTPSPQVNLSLHAILEVVACIAGSSVDADTALMDAGIDSLASVELRNQLQNAAGDRIAVSSTVIFDHPTARSLTSHLAPDEAPLLTPSAGGERASCNGETTRALTALTVMLPGGARSLPGGWHLIATACNAFSTSPTTRWESTPGAVQLVRYAPSHGAFVPAIEFFDHAAFGILEAEARSMDPQQRLLLELGYEALQSRGLSRSMLAGSETTVFVGIMSVEFRNAGAQDGTSVYAMTGTGHCFAAGRLSYVLGLHGTCEAIDVACSSALVACHNACRAIKDGERCALVAGINLMLLPGTLDAYARAGLTSAQGKAFVFDARADGFVRGEACGTGVIEGALAASPLARVHHCVVASAVRQDGRSASLTAPNGQAQRLLLRAALLDGGMSPMDLAIVEAAANGSKLGDPVEVGAVADALVIERADCVGMPPLVIGSIKANVGHTESASGLVGLAKLVCSMQRGLSAPNAQLVMCAAHVAMALDRVTAASALLSQQAPSATPAEVQRGTLSSFGLGGTIATAVVRVGVSFPITPGGSEILPALVYKRRALTWVRIRPLCLKLVSRGALSGMILREQAAFNSALTPSEVELQVQAVGLNFKDILNVLGELPAAFLTIPPGDDCAGFVTSVPSPAKRLLTHPVLRRGHELFGTAPGCLSFFARARTSALLVVRRPRQLSASAACTIPALWATVRSLSTLALNMLAQCHLCHTSACLPLLSAALCIPAVAATLLVIRPAQVHEIVRRAHVATKLLFLQQAATGGVGLVSVEYLQWLGALVHGTAGQPGKHRTLGGLRLVGRSSSRDMAAFGWGLMHRLRGSRLHGACNSLANDFIPTLMAALGEQGAFEEIGKRSAWHTLRLAAATSTAATSTMVIDLAMDMVGDLSWYNRLLRLLVSRLKSGVARSLPSNNFDMHSWHEAFRLLQRGEHVGKVVITSPYTSLLREADLFAPSANEASEGAASTAGTGSAPGGMDGSSVVPPGRFPRSVLVEEVLQAIKDTSGSVQDADASLEECGIDSLGSIELRNKLEHLAAMAVPSTVLFEHPTGRQLMVALNEKRELTGEVPVVFASSPFERPPLTSLVSNLYRNGAAEGLHRASLSQLSRGEEGGVPLFCVPALNGQAEGYRGLARVRTNPIYGACHPHLHTGASAALGARTLDEVTGGWAMAITSVVSRSNNGEGFVLLGASMGGALAHEVAVSCQRLSTAPQLICLIDPLPPRRPLSVALETGPRAAANALASLAGDTGFATAELWVEEEGDLAVVLAQRSAEKGLPFSPAAVIMKQRELRAARHLLDLIVAAFCSNPEGSASSPTGRPPEQHEGKVCLVLASERVEYFEGFVGMTRRDAMASAAHLYGQVVGELEVEGTHLDVCARCSMGRDDTFNLKLCEWLDQLASEHMKHQGVQAVETMSEDWNLKEKGSQ